MKIRQTLGSWVYIGKTGAKWTLYRFPLLLSALVDTPQEDLSPLGTLPAGTHARQAGRLFAQICGTSLANFKPCDLRIGAPFLLSGAVKQMVTGLVYGIGPESFAIGVHHMLSAEDPKIRLTKGIRGRPWMPLHAVAFGACFVSEFPVFIHFRLTSFSVTHRARTHICARIFRRRKQPVLHGTFFLYFFRAFPLRSLRRGFRTYL